MNTVDVSVKRFHDPGPLAGHTGTKAPWLGVNVSPLTERRLGTQVVGRHHNLDRGQKERPDVA